MIPLPIMGQPFERIAMGIVGPLPRSIKGYKYILVVCDYATRYPEAIPLKKFTADTVVEELITLFARYGVPKEILTDQGTNFTSQLLQELYKLLGVKPITTTPYHPQTDGLVERFNKTLKDLLRKIIQGEGREWEKYLPCVLFAYREVPQESTGFSPFELIFGRDVRGPLDILKEQWSKAEEAVDDILTYVTKVRERMEAAREIVIQNMKKSQNKQKEWYDLKARDMKLRIGDHVLVLLPTSTNKLLSQWHGPHEVTRVIGKVNYESEMPERKRKRVIFHTNMLKKWQTPEKDQSSMEETLLVVESEDSVNEENIAEWRNENISSS